MKNITKVLAISAIALVSANSSFAQATTSAAASATIITPITIAKTTDMNFGNVAVSASLTGTVVMSPASVRPATDFDGQNPLPVEHAATSPAAGMSLLPAQVL